MENGFFLITGTSMGIGKELAQNLLEKGHTVLGISRNRSVALKSINYYHLSFDLTDTSRINQIMIKVNEIVDNRNFDIVGLVNNASASEPGGTIEKCPSNEIDSHVKIGLIAPMILTSLFIRKFTGYKTSKKLVFISSEAALTAYPEDSIYCGTKAGLYMFAQCVGLEQKNKEFGFEVISIGPGMVDTPMQEVARSKSPDEYAIADFLKQAFEQGKLSKPADVAEKIYTILGNKYEQGIYVQVDEV